MEGKITKVYADRGFFFVDNDYWCGFRTYDKEPVEGDIVTYESEVLPDGKKRANRVKFIKSAANPIKDYIVEISSGYFTDRDYLKENLIIEYPQLLANLFVLKGNKVNQVRNYFDQVVNIAGVYKINKDFNRSKIELNKLIPMATKSFDKQNISNEFKEFIIENVKQAIKDEDSFIKGFFQHFECLVNYYPSKI
ncbi:MAG: hypothetical protein A2315_00270 [Ignavibacteria bacterium RIFOXYB2_FULL_35_12]|nr:MAG: hypothetical protein A2058_15600 [Ignavibacteria bacterium GWA2_36_19]OGU56284.1 MAG: hypothetical protein A2X60_15585 [Ignavibacteria bacterium GWF2_35_20]OGU78779.1 MAG: hypothetical protein A2254_14795 [Ignavibacteria bacterium RIFOXYA2_FULL_35_9]OGU88183.1 MAG: hypothetical protein A3K31_00380 [Ignavibacteria bacterium RIFOXYA12_FULL_35_25]OGU95988.1 MAG: hypothetical protein A2347_01260 [Ignavibacteria bacterium RIFOXYB12_FULL_35_14]OGU99351.1 MAG: hypothetical protein A2455_03020